MYILIGNYIDETIKKSRKLPSLNIAGSNRILRIGQAIASTDNEALIISTATAISMKWSGKLLHKSFISNVNNVKVLYCAVIGLPVLGSIFDLFSLPITFFKICRYNNVKGVMFYCYYPSNVITALLTRLFLRIPIIEDLEDICRPDLNDWLAKSNINPYQQLIGWVIMKMMIKCSNIIIIPTNKFRNHVKNKPVFLINGCIDVPIRKANVYDNKIINILFSGKLDAENGLLFLLNSITLLDQNNDSEYTFIFHICGQGSNESDIEKVKLYSKNVVIKYYRFLSNSEYSDLLASCHVSLVLQNPYGRFAKEKTPSKGYEFIGYGKTLIISDIGDFANLPDNIRIILKPYLPEKLVSILLSLDHNKIFAIGERAYNFARTNWSYEIIGNKIVSMYQNYRLNEYIKTDI